MRRWAGILIAGCCATTAHSASLQEALDRYAAGDAASAASIYADLAGQGDPKAQFNLALMFYAGEGVPQSWTDSFRWAWRAKLNGVEQAEILLGRIDASIGKPEREALAEELMAELAAPIAYGDGKAMLRMAIIAQDLLPRPDMVKAYVWQAMAVAAGLDAAVPFREGTFRSLSEKDRIKAQSEARTTFEDWCSESPAPVASCTIVN